MRIGALARQAGIRTSAIRYYEAHGLLPPPPRVSGRREYDAPSVDRLALLLQARRCGLTLREIRALFAPSSTRISARWAAAARAKDRELRDAIARAEMMRRELRFALRCRCLDLDACARRVRRRIGFPQRA
jgi:MerR family redox-sensitive transcriptional activator SoxR